MTTSGADDPGPHRNREGDEDEIAFMDVILNDLRVMDMTAITFCRDNGLPILVFDLMTPGNIRGALGGERIGTLIS